MASSDGIQPTPTETPPKRWAVLIGIDFYSEGDVRSTVAKSILNLRGCVRDILAVEEYLTANLLVEKSHIRKLTASTPDDVEQNTPEEDVSEIPTYENMVKAIESVTEDASPGDLVYIHYSGHGANVATTMPQLKGEKGIDEALVPTDIRTGGRYLRDIEIATLLSAMVWKGLIVTVTLDCCHSGSGTRGESGPVARGIGKLDDTVLPSDMVSLIATKDLERAFRSSAARNVKTAGDLLSETESWLLEPQGYELFAACRQTEAANEDIYPRGEGDGDWHGALSYHLLEALKARGKKTTTHGMLYQTVQANILNDFREHQTPIFAGNPGRCFFTTDEIAHRSTFAVRRVAGDSVVVAAGKVHAVGKGTVFELYAQDTQEFTSSECLAQVEVTIPKDFDSSARLMGEQNDEWKKVRSGCRALLVSRPPQQHLCIKQLQTNLSRMQKKKVDELHAAYQKKLSLDTVHFALEDIHYNDKSHSIHRFVVNDRGQYELWTETETLRERVPNFVPCNDPGVFAQRVEQVALYCITKNIRNDHEASGLKEKISFHVKGPHQAAGNDTVQVKDGATITVVFENNWTQPLNLTILDFQPLWGITQIYPQWMEAEDVLPGRSVEIPLEMSVPEGLTSTVAVDTLKAFVTFDRTVFKPLEREDIDMKTENVHAAAPRTDPRSGDVSLQELLDHFAPNQRNARVTSSPRPWETLEISVHFCDLPEPKTSATPDPDNRHPWFPNLTPWHYDGR